MNTKFIVLREARRRGTTVLALSAGVLALSSSSALAAPVATAAQCGSPYGGGCPVPQLPQVPQSGVAGSGANGAGLSGAVGGGNPSRVPGTTAPSGAVRGFNTSGSRSVVKGTESAQPAASDRSLPFTGARLDLALALGALLVLLGLVLRRSSTRRNM